MIRKRQFSTSHNRCTDSLGTACKRCRPKREAVNSHALYTGRHNKENTVYAQQSITVPATWFV